MPDLSPRREADEEAVRLLTEMIARKDRQISLLSAVAARTHGADDPAAVLDIALEEILGGLDLPAAWIFMGSQHDRKLHFAASRGVSASYLETIGREGLGDCLCPEVFETGHRMEARNTTQCPRMPTIIDGLREPVAHACIPLQLKGETKGVLNVAALPGQRFSDDELRFLETLGHQTCVALERARHLQAETLRNQEAHALAAINKAIGGSLDAQVVLGALGESAVAMLDADRVQLLLGDDARRMRVAHLSGLPHPILQEGGIVDLVDFGAKAHRFALEHRTALRVDDWFRDPRVTNELADAWGMAAGLLVPLVAGTRALGLLVVARQAPRPWTDVHLDIAETLAGQAAMALENARLYAESRKALEELQGAQQRLLQNEKMVTLGTFASGLAHEIRNPLNSMGLQLSLLERRIGRLKEGATFELREIADILRSEIARLDALVSDFLLFSRASRGQYRPASLEELADQVVRLLRPEARQANATLQRRSLDSSPIPLLPMDAEKMKQVILNLVRNAIEALPAQGLVVVETGLLDGRALLTVRDNGPGFPPELDVFQIFVTTKPKGTGLGLAIAQQIVSEHGGEISARSDPGSGAAFTVSLPIVEGPQAGPAKEER